MKPGVAQQQSVEAAGSVRAEKATARGGDSLDERAVTVLRERARRLAAAPDTDTGQERVEALVFLLGDETYGVEPGLVREVVPLRELTPLPGVPPFVLGLTNLRGRVLSVVDLKHFFNLPERGLTDLNKVIVLGSGSMEFGILADAVVGLRDLVNVAPAPSVVTLEGVRGKYLRGVAADGVILLDGAVLLGDPAIVVAEED